MINFTAVITNPEHSVCLVCLPAENATNALEKLADELYKTDMVEGYTIIGVYEGNGAFTAPFTKFGRDFPLRIVGEPRSPDAVMNAFGE